MTEVNICIGPEFPGTVILSSANGLQHMAVGYDQVPVYKKPCPYVRITGVDPTGTVDGALQVITPLLQSHLANPLRDYWQNQLVHS